MKSRPTINVTKTFLPPIEEYKTYLDKIWDNGKLTNQGPLLRDFESKVSTYLDIKNFHFVANGTLALQIAIKSLDISEGEIITTPFSYVATTSAILWQGCEPIFVDIDPRTLCIDSKKIEKAITARTKAIMPVHVFGNACDIEEIEIIAKKHNLKVIYDGAHAFGVRYKNKSLLGYGDISTCSFHSTKLFHTIEGGCVVSSEKSVSEKLGLIKKFGHFGDEHYYLGINAKASEFQAAMGLCNLAYIGDLVNERKKITELYNSLLGEEFQKPVINDNVKYNYAYYPIIFNDENQTTEIIKKLAKKDIHPRRYFYPSLNRLPYLENQQKCPISENISKRILCLPLYVGLEEKYVKITCQIIKGNDHA